MLGIERRRRILELLQQEHKVYVADLSESFGVTQETVRRDLDKLEQEGMLRRSYGGAVPTQPLTEDLSFASRVGANLPEKQSIAAKAAGLVKNGYSIMMDASTTALALVDALHNRSDLTVISNSVKLLHDYAAGGFAFMSTGGELRPHSFALVGPTACRALESWHVDLAVFSCKGLDRERGIMESNEPEAVVKQTMARQAKTRILLADHTKFDQVVFVRMLEYCDVDYVVTDREPRKGWGEFFRRNSIQLLY